MNWLFYALNVNEKTSFIKRELLHDFSFIITVLDYNQHGDFTLFNNLT